MSILQQIVTKLVMGFLLVELLTGCAQIQSKEKQFKLNETTKVYGSAIRWGQFNDAADFIAIRNSVPQGVDRALLKNIRVTSYDIADVDLSEDGLEALLTVSITYYHTNSGIINTITDRQMWWYSEELKGWLLDGSLPDFAQGLTLERQ